MWNASRRYSGHFTVRLEEQSFTPCGSGETWWVNDPGPLLARCEPPAEEGGSVTMYVTVDAEVTERGRYGHFGMFPRAMAVREVVEARPAGENDCDYEMEGG